MKYGKHEAAVKSSTVWRLDSQPEWRWHHRVETGLRSDCRRRAIVKSKLDAERGEQEKSEHRD